MPFEQWQKGEELFANLDREYDLLDRDVRPFLEECDQLQGIQVLSGIDDAWGGFTSKYLERLADELGKGSRWVFGLQDTQRVARDRQALQLANVAQSMYSINSSASMHVPLASLPSRLPAYLAIDGMSRWSTSALEAVAIESVTLSARLRSTQSARATFDNLETTLNGDGKRRIAATSLSAQNPAELQAPASNANSDARLANGLHHDQEPQGTEEEADINMFPVLPRSSASTGRRNVRRNHTFSRLDALRGAWRTATDIQQSNEQARNRFASTDAPRVSIHQSALLFPILSSYPALFHLADRPQKLAVQASLATTTAIAEHLRGVEGFARRMVGIDEREALCDGLSAMADEYEEGYASSTDSDED